MSGEPPLLELDHVTKRFGELVAVDDLSFTIEQDAGITALIGPNGAGKTTTYNVMTGKLSPSEGAIRFRGTDISDESPAERTHRGLGRSFQITNIFEGLSVRRNIRAPVIARTKARRNVLGNVNKLDDVHAEVERVLDLVGLEDIADEPCENLPYGDKRRVEIGITLATDPDLVLLDEPTAGMNPTETMGLVELIEQLDQETETSFFITEHDMNVVFSIADRIIVLNRGSILADETPAEIQQNPDVQTAYLGSDDDGDLADRVAGKAAQSERKLGGETVLDVDDIHTYYGQSHVLTGVSLEVHKGEIVSILGRNGAGKTTTLRSIIGLAPPRRGEVTFHGNTISGKDPYTIARAGIGFVPEERRIFTDLTVKDNIEMRLDQESDWTLERVYDMFPRLRERSSNKGYQLSGGEQQMLTVARALVTDPDLLLLDEPSEGLAPVIVDDLEDVLNEIIDLGVTVLLTEQNIEFALSLAERNYILNNGQVEWEGTTEELLDNQDVIETYISLSGVGERETADADAD